MGTSFPSKGDENPSLGFRNGSAPVQEPGIFPQVDLSDDPSAGTFLGEVKGTLQRSLTAQAARGCVEFIWCLAREESWTCAQN